MFDVIVVGCGYAGSIMARKFADDGKHALILEKRGHIAGNMYDYHDENGILTHKYGPHISYMDEQSTLDFLTKFSEFVPYEHTVNAEIDGIEVPLPFNFTAIEKLFNQKDAGKIVNMLIETYGMGAKIPIIELMKSTATEIRSLAQFIYDKVFLHYTMKMWDLRPDEIDPSVTARVPVRVSYDNRHFTSPIQVMPKHGFTKLFENMINHANIELQLSTDALNYLKLSGGIIYFDGAPFSKPVIFTGAIDSLFDYKFGSLPYRSLHIEHETHEIDRLQDSTVLNWPDKRTATRRTESKLLNCQDNIHGVTSTTTEYPGEYDKADIKFFEPYYPILHHENSLLYEKYRKEADRFSNLILVGRLAEYKYYNMEGIIQATLRAYDRFLGR